MRIRILPRIFFERIKGTEEENLLLEKSRIISINSSWGGDAEAPFSSVNWHHPHLLRLTFDDIENEPAPEEATRLAAFSSKQAEQIIRFVDDGKLPLLIHCTAGISRSGAVGEVLDWYFNCYLADNAADHQDFVENNRQILPNALVRRVMLHRMEERLSLFPKNTKKERIPNAKVN